MSTYIKITLFLIVSTKTLDIHIALLGHPSPSNLIGRVKIFSSFIDSIFCVVIVRLVIRSDIIVTICSILA